MTEFQQINKRLIDIVLSFLGLVGMSWIILLSALLAWVDTGKSGFFKQKRIGLNGEIITVFKIRSMREIEGIDTTITTRKDPRISAIGSFWRKTKIDELPQLWHVFTGHMSFVGPRPDVPGYADKLEGEDRRLLSIRPGITGLASVYFKDEEKLLADQDNPSAYNDEVIWPKKVRINLYYLDNYSLITDIKLIIATVIPIFRKRLIEDIEKL